MFTLSRGLPPQISTEDFFPRYLEFQNFESKFCSCLSNAAVRTKFAQHTQRGKGIVASVARYIQVSHSVLTCTFMKILTSSRIMTEVNSEAMKHQESQVVQKKELWDRCDFTEKQLELMTLEMKEKIHQVSSQFHAKIRIREHTLLLANLR